MRLQPFADTQKLRAARWICRFRQWPWRVRKLRSNKSKARSSNSYLKPKYLLSEPPIFQDWRFFEVKLFTPTISCLCDRQALQKMTDESIAHKIIFRRSKGPPN